MDTLCSNALAGAFTACPIYLGILAFTSPNNQPIRNMCIGGIIGTCFATSAIFIFSGIKELNLT